MSFAKWTERMDRLGFTLASGVNEARYAVVNWDLMLGNSVTAENADRIGVDDPNKFPGCVFVPGKIGQIGSVVVSGPKIIDDQLKIMGLPSFVVVAHIKGQGVTVSDVDDVSDLREMAWTAIRPAGWPQ